MTTLNFNDDRSSLRKSKMTKNLHPNVLVYDHTGIVRSEDNEQKACVSWFDYEYPALSLSLFYVPNETFIKNKSTAQKKIEMGVRSGVSDLILALPTTRYPYACIELKKKGGMPTDNQIAFLNCHAEKGALCAVVRGHEAFKRFIEKYLQYI